MNIYDLKICKKEDKPLLINFIKDYWSEDHVFVKSEELLRFQHFNNQSEEFNFILGYNTHTGEIDGLIGIIPLSHYDPELSKYNETFGGIWKVRTDVKNDEIGLLGILLLEEFNKYTSHSGSGMSSTARKLLPLMKYKTDKLSQYYIINYECKDFKICKAPKNKTGNNETTDNLDFYIKEIFDLTSVRNESIEGIYWPRKSLTYLINRFQNHPFYSYSYQGIYDNNNKLKTILVLREISIKENKVMRIVDVFGPLEGLGTIKKSILKLLKKKDAEYIDILNSGIDPKVFYKLGFELLNVDGDIIIPNYFEPFIQRNDIVYSYYRAPYKCTIFKADADQDRPNILNYEF